MSINLFCGCWIVKDSQKYNISKYANFIPLLTTYFIGPFGIIFYWIIRIFYSKKVKLFLPNQKPEELSHQILDLVKALSIVLCNKIPLHRTTITSESEHPFALSSFIKGIILTLFTKPETSLAFTSLNQACNK